MSVFTAFAFWVDGVRRMGRCTCGEPEGHAGWLVCFHTDTSTESESA